MFENLGFGGAEGEGMGGLFPLMQVMLENILSKEVLYPPMKEITDKVGLDSCSYYHHHSIIIGIIILFLVTGGLL